MNRRHTTVILVIILVSTWLLTGQSTNAAPFPQTDPAALCAEGIQLAFAGRTSEALPLLEAGFAARESAIFADPDSLGQCALLLGLLREDTDDWPGALEAYTVAREISQSSHNRDLEQLALNSLGGVYRHQIRYGEALTAYEQALTISRERGNRASEEKTLVDIGLVYQELGRYPEAVVAYEQALSLSRQVGNRAEEGTILNNIGAVYQARGLYEEALGAFEQSLSVGRELGDWLGQGITLNNIGEVYRGQGRLPEALGKFQDALVIHREVGNKLGEGHALNSIGAVYETQGRYEEALESFELALDIWQEVGYGVGEGGAFNNIAGVYDDQGHYAEALEMYQQALIIRREVGDRLGEGITLNNIGEIHRVQGHYAEALENYQQALDIAREVGDQTGEGTILDNIGMVYEARSQVTEALEFYLKAMDILETVRATAGSEVGRSSFIAQYAGLYASTVDLLHQQGQDRKAFIISERGRARAFLDSLTTRQVQLGDNVAAELLAQESELYVQRQAIQDNLAQARVLIPPDPVLVADLEAQLVEVASAYMGVQESIQARGDQLADLIPGRSKNLWDVPAIQAILDPQTSLISFFVLEDKTLAFLITQSDFQTVALDVGYNQLGTEVQNFRDFVTIDEAYPESMVKLHNWLIAPLQEELSTPHWAIIPHGVLHYLPFTALNDGERYLIDDYSLTILPSASTLPFIQENAHQTAFSGQPSALIAGNPVTADYDTVASLATTRGSLGSLPFAEKEAKAIAEVFGVEPLIGKVATESAVREDVAEANILHLAAHGKFNPVAPLNSLIALAPDEVNDGWLTVHESYGLNLKNTTLVVLSACETNLGDLSAGDELVGLTRALIFAGTPSVIASLWAVDDEATSLLMERFYTHLKDGSGKAEALRQAQLEMREDYPHPYYWSGFVLSGDPGEIEPRSIASNEVEPPRRAGAGEKEINPDDEQAEGIDETSVDQMESDPMADTASQKEDDSSNSTGNGGCLTLLLPLTLLSVVGAWLKYPRRLSERDP